MKNINLLSACLLYASLSLGIGVYAEETKIEKVETSANRAADKVKSTYRNAKDKTCEMIDGKMKCVNNKIKNKIKNLKDKADTQATEVKNKID